MAATPEASDSAPSSRQEDLLVMLPDGSVYAVPTAVLSTYRVDRGWEQRYREIRAEDVLPGFEYADDPNDEDADAGTTLTTTSPTSLVHWPASPSSPRGTGQLPSDEAMSGIAVSYPGLREVCAGAGPGTKEYFAGTHRVVAPEATLERWRPHMATFGITRLADITDLDVIGIPVAQAIRPNSRTLSVAQGKGTSPAAAEASALMEGTEFWHAENHRLPLRRASWAGSSGETTVDLGRLPRRAGAALDCHQPILWASGRDLVGGAGVWVPEALVGMDYTPPRDPLTDCFLMSSGGLASGNHLLEAVAHALYEVIERDAWALASVSAAGREPIASLDLDSVDDPVVRGLVDRCRSAQVRVLAWDITSDIGLPCVAATVQDDSPAPFRPLPATSGMGCHPSAAVALSRAITEAVAEPADDHRRLAGRPDLEPLRAGAARAERRRVALAG